MLVRLLRNIFIALLVFAVIGLIEEVAWSFTQPIERYVTYVLTTDFDYRPVLEQVSSLGNSIGEWDFAAMLDELPRITTGR